MDRTCDLRFRKPLLYPLSYEGGDGAKCGAKFADTSASPLIRLVRRDRRFYRSRLRPVFKTTRVTISVAYSVWIIVIQAFQAIERILRILNGINEIVNGIV